MVGDDAGLAAIIRSALAGIVVVRRDDGRIVEANEPFAAALGWRRDELIGRTTAEIDLYVDPSTRTRIYEALARDGKVVRMEVLVRARSGAHASYLLTMHPLAFGGEACAVAFWEDVTEIKRVDAALQQSEAALEEAEERSRLALDAAELGTWRYDMAAGAFHLDPRARAQFGIAQASMSEAEMFARVHPEDRARLAAALTGARRPGATGRATIEHRIVLPDNQVRWLALHIHITFTGEGADRVPAFGLAACRDITATCVAAEALRASEDRYRSLVDNLEDVVFSLDLAGCITFVSRAVGRLGYEPAQMLGSPVANYVHPDDREKLRASFAHRLAGRASTGELRWLDARGSTRYLRYQSRPQLLDGHVVGITGLITDVTQQHETEDKLRAAQRMEAVGRLAGGVAHDFNNLLSVILSYTELAAESVPADAPLRADLAEIGNAAARAAGLTRQLLAFSRRQVLEPERVELGALMASLTNMLRRLIGEDIELQVERAADLFEVVVDKGQLEQVVMNLAVNARDAMTDGGTLRIAMQNAPLDEPTAAALEVPPGDYVELAITDTGTGIPDGVRERIFEPFFTTKGVGKGTGLGLAMVHGMVKQSGGGIAVETALGRGTTFRVYLPRGAEPPATARTAPDTPPTGPRGHERILLVEDEEALRHVVQRALTSVGYEVVAAANAAEALQICEHTPGRFDLVLTDVVMPGIDGRRFVERLPPPVRGTKVLFMSGYTDEVIAHHGVLDLHFLRKPFAREVLTAKVRSVLDGPRSGAMSPGPVR